MVSVWAVAGGAGMGLSWWVGISFLFDGTAHRSGAAVTDCCRLLGSVYVNDNFLSH